MGDFDGRLIVLLMWGGGTVGAYTQVFVNRLRSWRYHHDARARRDLLEGTGLLIAALASALSTAMLLFTQGHGGLRGFLIALALGAFLAVGVYMAQEERR